MADPYIDSLDEVERQMAMEEARGLFPHTSERDAEEDDSAPLVRTPNPKRPHGQSGASAKPEPE